MDCTVVTGTFGHTRWTHLARTRAWPSVVAEKVPWVHVHGSSLADARNRALEQVETEWVIHLDADDALESGYVEAMGQATSDLRGPAVRYVGNIRERAVKVPQVLHHDHACEAKCLLDGNWLVVGTAVRTEMVREVGGWRDFDWSEDWDLWLRCYLAGATVEAVPDAIYRAQITRDSRNRAPSARARLEAHQAIHYANGLPEREWPKAA